ncbi:D-alanyl-D-alanine carboxypeptidase family protein [Pseudoclostridium thermosuccinogenes]|uniref:D-alanyl-D-alanine carboxypeptidase family protein n=1 Tax=Clostridium thermosuccinogenes TaxID=84032 RepID=UPI002FD8D5C7
MRKIFSVLLAISVLSACISNVHAEELNIDAPSYILIDPETGRSLAEKEPDEKMYPASTTKIMTAIIALEQGDLNQMATASAKAIDLEYGSMHIGIMQGEQIVLEDLLNAMMVRSANDAANIIAENVGASYDDFIEQMNKKARELGATNTHFVNPHGMHNDDHYTTVRDMATIARYAMSIDKFREIVKKPYYDMKPTNKHEEWDRLYTINRFLTNLQEYKSDYFTPIGIKSGYTSQAGNTLVSAAVNDSGMELIAVVFGAKGSNNNSDVYDFSKELLEYGFKNFSRKKLLKSNQLVESVNVEDATDNPSLDLVAESDISAILPSDQDLSLLEKNIVLISPTISAPVSKGDVLGYVEFRQDGVLLGKTNIVASRSIDKSTKAIEKFSEEVASARPRLKNFLIGTATALVAFLLLRIILRRISRARFSSRYSTKSRKHYRN